MKKLRLSRIILCITVIAALLAGAGVCAFASDGEPEWAQSYIKEVTSFGITNYYSPDGTCLAPVESGGITWIYCRTDATGERFWVGLDDPDGMLKDGDIFSIRWIRSDEFTKNSRDFSETDGSEEDRDAEQLAIMEFGLKDPDGTRHRDINGRVFLYVQPIDRFSDSILRSIYIGNARDEIVDKVVERIIAPDGERCKFIRISLNYHSEELPISEQIHFDWRSSLMASVFSEHQPLILCLGAAVVLAVPTVTLIRIKKKGDNQK